MEFKVDNEIKQEYLNLKPTKTAKSDTFVLRDFDEYESKVGKEVYNLSINELNEMFATLRNSSQRAAGKNKSILVNYIDFCVSKKIVPHMENRAKYIDVEKFVHRQALLNKYVPRETLMEYQKLLFNEQDQLLVWLLYIGVRGRTVEEGTLEEVINLNIKDVSPDANRLILRQNDGKARVLDNVDTFIIELIQDVYEQEYYIENNGEITNNPRLPDPRRSKINKTGESKTGETIDHYVFRTPGKNKYEKFSLSLLNSRIRRIQKYVGNPYLTYSSLYFSGMIQMGMDIYHEKGEISKEDYINICDRYNYGSGNPAKYWHVLKEEFEQYKELLLK
jgi:hypothetical protein